MLDDDAPPKELLLERRYSHVRCECEASPLDPAILRKVQAFRRIDSRCSPVGLTTPLDKRSPNKSGMEQLISEVREKLRALLAKGGSDSERRLTR
jgi:hypothetical protein